MIIRVGIVDDHAVVVNGLKYMLLAYPDVRIQFALTDCMELPAVLHIQQPDVLLLNINTPGHNGGDLCQMVHREYPGVKIIAMANFQVSFYVKEVFRNGAVGYLLKNMDQHTLRLAIDTVHEGGRFVDVQVKAALPEETGAKKKDALTRRETEILGLIAREFSSREIADRLFVSPRTVDTHRFNIIQKLQVKNAAGLIKEAYKRGLL